MKISLKWLSDFVEVSEFFQEPEKLSDVLTKAGLEVEAVENKSQQFENVVIGHILELSKHPNADKLTLCQVSTGQGVVHQIVCGAKNHKQGDRVVVALPGAVLPGDFKIKKSKIRDVVSNGMLCSESELALAEESEGIMILSEDAPIGQSFAEYKGLDDIVFELKVTPNRADCLSHYGLAREISTVLGRPIKKDLNVKLDLKGNTQKQIKLSVKNQELCPRYSGRFIENVTVGPSPEWLKQRVESVGMNSINNIVDITNYVMLELGQPLHAFDVRELQGAEIIVDLAEKGEKFQTLDGTGITLDGTELMIRDSKRAVALAGVVGGKNSGVQSDTTQVFLESAYFSPQGIRRTARQHGIETESGYRFSRGVDPETVLVAMNRACELICEIAGGLAYDHHHDFYPNPLENKQIEVTTGYVSERLGYEVQSDQLQNWLLRLNCKVVVNNGHFQVTAPLYRQDLEIAEDLVEEYARLQGYDEIPEKLPAADIKLAPHDLRYVFQIRLNELSRAQGFQEAVNYCFIDKNFQADFVGDVAKLSPYRLGIKGKPVDLVNPISEELNTMRISVSASLFKNIYDNVRRGIEFGRFFELGFTFENQEGQYHQDWRLGLVMWGRTELLWSGQQKSPLVLELKARIDNILRGVQGRNWKWVEAENPPDFFHPGQCAALFYEGKNIGLIGTLHPKLAKKYKIRPECALAEINLEALSQGQPRVQRVKDVLRTPVVERDLAFVMPVKLTAQEVMDQIQRAGKPLLKSVHVFDEFMGHPLKEGEKSLAFRMHFQDAERTLKEDEVTQIEAKIIDAVGQKFKIQVR